MPPRSPAMRAPEFWRNDGLPARMLSPLGRAVGAAAELRQGMSRRWKAPIPVICVGNLVTGGAGKTPVALALAARLASRGTAPHFLSRGYGGRMTGPALVDAGAHGPRDVGDEPLLLARLAPTWVARDRVAGARAAVDAGAEIIVMDDGFQNPYLAKDLSIVVIDGGYGFGNRRVMPAGPLREPIARGLARADAVVVVGEDRVGVESLLSKEISVLRARLVPSAGGERLAGGKVFAFAGIGRPEKFFATLVELGCELTEARPFPDHHRYDKTEVMKIVEDATALGAIPVTTAKDMVRLPTSARAMVEVLDVDIEWDDPAALDALLGGVVDRPRSGKRE